MLLCVAAVILTFVPKTTKNGSQAVEKKVDSLQPEMKERTSQKYWHCGDNTFVSSTHFCQNTESKTDPSCTGLFGSTLVISVRFVVSFSEIIFC